MSNLRQLGLGVQAYANRDRGWLPQKGPDGSTPLQSFKPGNYGLERGFDDPSVWFNAVPPLINDKSYYDMLVDNSNGIPAPHPNGSPSVFICPSSGDIGTLGGNDRIVGDYFLLYGIDASGRIKNSTGLVPLGNFEFAMSYVWNSKLTTTLNETLEKPIKMSDIQDSSNTILMLEKLNNPGEYLDPIVQNYNKMYPEVYNSVKQTITLQGYNNNIAQSKADYRRFTTRHSHGGHLLFADGHVAYFLWADVQIPRDQMPYNPAVSDANHPGMIWSALGPVN